jgi:hypothetical protein
MTVTSVQIQNGHYTENYKSFNEGTLPNKVMVNMELTTHIVQLQDGGIDIYLRGRKPVAIKETIDDVFGTKVTW